MVAAVLVCLVSALPAWAQMSLGNLSGKLPPEPPSASLLLGKDIENFRAWWAKPVNEHQAMWKNNAAGRANSGLNAGKPPKFGESGAHAATTKAAALRWAMEPNGPNAKADLDKALTGLKNAAIPGGTEITRNEPLTSYLMAYDFTRSAPWSKEDRAEIEANLTTLAKSLGGGDSDSNVRGKVAGTRGFAGVVLHNQPLVDQALKELQNHFNYSTTNDGWFTDSQSHYLNYTLTHVAVFARALHQATGADLFACLQPYADESIAMRLPSGRGPGVSNGTITPVGIHYFSFTPNAKASAEMLWYVTTLPTNAFDLTNLMNNDWTYINSFVLTDFSRNSAAPDRSPTFLATGQSGISVFRNDWGPQSNYLLLSPGVDSPPTKASVLLVSGLFPAYHSHNDTGEIVVAAAGEYILPAAGYDRRDLSNSPKGLDPKRADWHNVLLVDGDLGSLPGNAGELPTNGETAIVYGGPNLGRATRPGDFEHTDRLDATERGNYKGAADLATLVMKYNGATVRRTAAFINEDYFVVADAVTSDKDREYAFNLVGRGEQTVINNAADLVKVKWSFKDRKAIEHLVSTHPMAVTTAQQWLMETYNVFEKTYRATTAIKARDAGFLAVIETGMDGKDAKADTALAVTSKSTQEFVAATVTSAAGAWSDTLLSQQKATPRKVGALASDAQFAYLRKKGDAAESGAINRGTTLASDGKPLLTASKPITLSFIITDAGVKATIAKDGFTPGTVVQFHTVASNATVTLNGKTIEPARDGGVKVTLAGAGNLVVE